MLNRKIGLKPDKNPVEEIPKLRGAEQPANEGL